MNNPTPKPIGLKSITLGNHSYTPVNERINWVRDNYPNYKITTTLITPWDADEVWVEATYYPDYTVPERCFNGRAQSKWITGEKKKNKWGKEIEEVDRTSALENAETSSIGRALAAAGIGTEVSYASADEINKASYAEGRSAPVAPKAPIDFKKTVPVAPLATPAPSGIPKCELCPKEIDTTVRNYSSTHFNGHSLCYGCQMRVRKHPELIGGQPIEPKVDPTDEGRELDAQRELESLHNWEDQQILNR